MKKVIVVGLDGLEPRIVDALLAAGELPNLDRLRKAGGYSRVQTTYPAQTPVAWSTFATGTNPGGHGVFDFLGRDPKTYLPVLGLSRYEQKNAFLPPKAVNSRRGTPVWSLLSEAGVGSRVLRCPCTFPPESVKGSSLLAGVGVPDLRGGMGTSTYYTSRTDLQNGESERVLVVAHNGDAFLETHLIGPRNPKSGQDVLCPMRVEVRRAEGRIIIHTEGRQKPLEVAVGQWSDWLKVKFKVGAFQWTHGMLRFYLEQIDPHLGLYATPINFDPELPLFPISYPSHYAADLADEIGLYSTLGMVEDHHGLSNGRFGEEAFLSQCDSVLRERERMLAYELDRFDSGFLYCLFDTPDRLQHMFWRFREPDHPANGLAYDQEFSRTIEDHYRRLDRIVGDVLQRCDDETLLIVLSDHGMTSFQRGLNLNTWLYEAGLLCLKSGHKPGDEAGDFFKSVDWSHTKAYALGLGGIYLNLEGREAQGIVKPADAGVLKSSIAEALSGLVDQERSRVAVRSVLAREQLYHGPFSDEAPDLLCNFEEGYRVSWGTPLGGVPHGLFENNTKKWSGDHTVNPALVPGVLFMNRAFSPHATLADLAPTILGALGVPKGSAMEGESLLQP